MNEIIKNDLIDTAPLEIKSNDIAKNMIAETDLDNLKNLINEFNLNQTKKDAIRVLKYNNLLDQISDQIIERFKKHPDEFTNSDLLQYLQSIQAAMDKSNRSLNNISDINPITINQINVNTESMLDRESRDRITSAFKAIQAILNNEDNNNDLIEPDMAQVKKGDNTPDNE